MHLDHNRISVTMCLYPWINGSDIQRKKKHSGVERRWIRLGDPDKCLCRDSIHIWKKMWTTRQITSPQFMKLDNSFCDLRCSGEQHRVSADGFWGKLKVGQIHMTWYSWGIWDILLCICFIYDKSLASMLPLCQSELVSFWTYTDNVPYITSDALFCFYYILFPEHLLLFFVKARSLSGLYNSPITMLGYSYFTHYTGGQTKIQES